MQPTGKSGYELCYVGARHSVPVSPSESIQDHDLRASDHAPAGWLAWGRAALAVAVVAVLVTLGVANIALYSRWHEVEDGVLWGARSEGVTALEVATGSAASRAGVARGDVLLAVNGTPVETPEEVLEYQHRSE